MEHPDFTSGEPPAKMQRQNSQEDQPMANEPEKQADDERQEDQLMANEHQQPANEPATHEQVLDAHYDLVELGQFFYENGFFLMKKMNLSAEQVAELLRMCAENHTAAFMTCRWPQDRSIELREIDPNVYVNVREELAAFILRVNPNVRHLNPSQKVLFNFLKHVSKHCHMEVSPNVHQRVPFDPADCVTTELLPPGFARSVVMAIASAALDQRLQNARALCNEDLALGGFFQTPDLTTFGAPEFFAHLPVILSHLGKAMFALTSNSAEAGYAYGRVCQVLHAFCVNMSTTSATRILDILSA